MHRPYLRPLEESDWLALRALRLHALRTEPGVYFSTLEAEFAHSEEQWRTLAANRDARQRMFGLFEGEVLIGITGAFTYHDDPSGRTAIFGMSYLRPEYRGQGFAQLFYEARLTWVRSNPAFTRVRVSHRRSNEPSRRAIERSGFAHVGEQTRTWHDGIEESELLYDLVVLPIAIRPRTSADIAECIEILKTVHEHDDYPRRWPDDPAAWLSPNGLFGAWVAVRGSAIEGHVATGHLEDELAGVTAPAGEVKRLFVRPAARGAGVGAALLQHAQHDCRERGLPAVLRVLDGQAAAMALYERAGWTRTGSYRASWQTPSGKLPLVHIYAYRSGV